MEVILLRDVESLGQKGEVANVADGYASNFLFPRKLAQEATAGRVAAVRRVLDAKADRERREDEQAEATRDLLNKTVISIPVAVGTGDRLFGSVTNQDVADAIWAARKIRIDKRKILLDGSDQDHRYVHGAGRGASERGSGRDQGHGRGGGRAGLRRARG